MTINLMARNTTAPSPRNRSGHRTAPAAADRPRRRRHRLQPVLDRRAGRPGAQPPVRRAGRRGRRGAGRARPARRHAVRPDRRAAGRGHRRHLGRPGQGRAPARAPALDEGPASIAGRSRWSPAWWRDHLGRPVRPRRGADRDLGARAGAPAVRVGRPAGRGQDARAGRPGRRRGGHDGAAPLAAVHRDRAGRSRSPAPAWCTCCWWRRWRPPPDPRWCCCWRS